MLTFGNREQRRTHEDVPYEMKEDDDGNVNGEWAGFNK